MNEEHLAKVNSNSNFVKVNGSCPTGANRRASGAKTATTTANGANRRASVAGAKSATPTACVTSAEMALGLRTEEDLAQLRRGASSPLSFFVAVGAHFFQRPLVELKIP